MKLTKIFKVDYFCHGEVSHSYEERWENTDLFCPRCGKHDVWHEDDAGDYYCGEYYLCRDCGAHFTIQGPHDPGGAFDEQFRQRLAKLGGNVNQQFSEQDQPTTKGNT